MHRREMIGHLGVVGASMTFASGIAQADGPEKQPNEDAGSMAGPADGFPMHFCGIHLGKENPELQLIVQHYCGPCGELHQCLLFDSPGKHAKLIGVEYIISDGAYRALPAAEKKYWHPHTYEVLAGGLIAPEMKPADEAQFMKALLTTWGKTWHTWPDPSTSIPLGEPTLMWAATGDGQIDPRVFVERDRQFDVAVTKIRAQRCKDLGYEVPQVPLPRSVDDAGRQWNATGEDQPTRRK